MKTLTIACLLLLAPLFSPEDPPKPPEGRAWLLQLEGEWKATLPGGEVEESIHAIGRRWIVCESKYPASHGSLTTLMTLGYDTSEQVFIGTWVDSSSDYLWTYRGQLEEDGRTLTLEAEGPGLTGGTMRYRDVLELKDADTKVHRNFYLDAEGKWVQMGEATSIRG